MKLWSTISLKLFITLIGLAALAICLFVLPEGIVSELNGDFDYGVIMVGMYVSAIPFFYALWLGIKLLNLVDAKQAFSIASAMLLKRIQYCAFVIAGMYVLGMPYIFYVADRDDAPGVAAAGFIVIGASFTTAAASAVFSQLIRSAVDIKQENDLTV